MSYTEDVLGILEYFLKYNEKIAIPALIFEDLKQLSESQLLKRVYELLSEHDVITEVLHLLIDDIQ